MANGRGLQIKDQGKKLIRGAGRQAVEVHRFFADPGEAQTVAPAVDADMAQGLDLATGQRPAGFDADFGRGDDIAFKRKPKHGAQKDRQCAQGQDGKDEEDHLHPPATAPVQKTLREEYRSENRCQELTRGGRNPGSGRTAAHCRAARLRAGDTASPSGTGSGSDPAS